MKGKFKKRSLQEEMLDSPNVSTRLLVQNLRELDFLNRHFGGHAVSLSGLKQLVKDKNRIYRIADLGCGSGDWLRYTARWARKNNYKMELTGVDRNADAIRYLVRKSSNFPEIKGFTGSYQEYLQSETADIYHCGLFCHHLDDDELPALIRTMKTKASVGFVINDLQRSPAAYYGAKAFTSVFRGSPLSRHDGPVSVLRGFRKKEIEDLLRNVGVSDYRISGRPFFRFLVVARSSPGEEQNSAKN